MKTLAHKCFFCKLVSLKYVGGVEALRKVRSVLERKHFCVFA